jgi:acetyl esterase
MRQTYYGPDESALPSGAVPGLVTDLSGAASAIVVTASHDPTRDGAEAYGARLRAAGVQTALLRYPGVYHGFLMRTEYLARARLALAEIGALVRARLAAQSMAGLGHIQS